MSGRRSFLLRAGGAAVAALAGPALAQNAPPGAPITGTEHWTTKKTPDGDVRLFLWRKRAASAPKGALVFVHGSSVQSVPSYDLQVPGKPEASVMDWFARLGYDTWCFDCEGYGRSDKRRPVNADIPTGAEDVAAAVEYIVRTAAVDKVSMFGTSSGGLRALLYAQGRPERIARLAVAGFVWTGEGSPTLTERRKRLPQYRANHRRPIDREFVRSIFTRDKTQATDPAEVEIFADAVLAMDDSMPTGTYVDMSANLPVVDPQKIKVPLLIMRGQFDGIATERDVLEFYARLPNPDKQFAVMPGVAHSSMHTKNWRFVFHLMDSYYSQPPVAYTGGA